MLSAASAFMPAVLMQALPGLACANSGLAKVDYPVKMNAFHIPNANAFNLEALNAFSQLGLLEAFLRSAAS